MKSRKLLLVFSTLSFLLAAATNAATLAVDQTGGTVFSGGYNSPVIQTFMPGQDNIAGVDVFIGGTAVLTEDVTVNVYSDLDVANPIASDTILDLPRSTWAEFRWDAVAVTPNTGYRFEFLTGSLVVAAQISNSVDPYDRGNVIQGGGNLLFAYEDALFVTYYDTEFSAVPIPAAAWLLGSALLGLGVLKRRTA